MKRIPMRAKGAVLINPRPKRASSRSARIKALFGGTKKRRNPSRRRRAARKPLGELVVNPRRRRRARKASAHRRTRRNPVRRRASRRRKNPVRRRSAARRSPVRRRNPRRRSKRKLARGSLIRTRRNPRRKASRRRNPMRRRYARRRNGIKSTASTLFASFLALAPQTLYGAISVEPTFAIAQIAARYWPGLSTTALYPLSGLALGVAIKWLLPKVGVSKAMADQLATATVAGGGAVGYYKWRTGQSTDAATEMAGLVLNGYGSPLAGLVMGDAGLGELVSLSGYGGYGATSYGNAAYATHMNGAQGAGMTY